MPLACVRDRRVAKRQGEADLDGRVRRLVHGGHARAVELPREALNVALKRHWPHAGLEVE